MASIGECRQSAQVDEEKNVTATPLYKVKTGDEFPPAKKVFLIMIALYLSMFLVALVIYLPTLCSFFLTQLGPDNHWHRDTQDHR
jgi:hypothetical protein